MTRQLTWCLNTNIEQPLKKIYKNTRSSTIAFFPRWKQKHCYHATEVRIILEKKLTRGFSFILLTGQSHEKLSELKVNWDKTTIKFYFTHRRHGSDTQLKKTHRGFQRRQSFPLCFCSSRLLTVCHIFPLLPKEEKPTIFEFVRDA
ncbi:hypothetical protein ATANTOWER_028323 [Ataeniobius toweri]|uniref:Uncharacterized protein n=1 Tax=Ataeniobius toweri TaxID=208326 RepID=A0ABU7AJB6_9TELE|nr:hypothetical protein [Ataeniobius toweri]